MKIEILGGRASGVGTQTLRDTRPVSGPVEDTDKELAVTAGVQGHY